MPDLSFVVKADNQTGSALSEAKAQVDDAAASADDAGGKFSGLTSHITGLLAVAGGVGAAFGAFSAAKGAVDDVTNLASSVKDLADVTGSTPEAASQLVYAFGQMGINADQSTTILDKFSKGLNGLIENEDGTTTKSNALTDQLKSMGIATTDSAGNALSMQQVMGQVADQFQKMPDGPQKTALALQLFGRSGADMIPMLDQGSAGLQQMYDKSNQLGLTLSGSTLDSVYKNTLAQREFGAALEGLKVQIGTALLPVLTMLMQGAVQLAEWFTTKAVPAIQQFADWLGPQLQPRIAAVQAAIAQIIPQVEVFAEQLGAKLLPIIQQIVSWLDQHRAVALALAGVIATLAAGPIVALIAASVLIYQHWQDLVNLWNTALPTLRSIGDAFMQVAQAIMHELQPLLDYVTGTFWPNLRQDFQAIVDFWTGVLQPALVALVNFIQSHWTQIESLFQGPLEAVETILTGAFASMKTIVEGAMQVLRDLITAAMDLIHGDWSGAWQAISDIPKAIFDTIVSLITTQLTTIEGLLQAAWDTIKADMQVAWDALKTVLSSAWDDIKQGAQTGISNLETLIQALPGQIVSWLGDAASLLYNWGKALIEGAAKGITDNAGALANAVKGALSNIPGAGVIEGALSHFAAGGIVDKPTLAVIGEAGPEAVVPLSGLSRLPPAPLADLGGRLPAAPAAGTAAAAGGGGSVFTINISALDAAGVAGVMPMLLRQLDLFLKQGGGLGLTGTGAAAGGLGA